VSIKVGFVQVNAGFANQSYLPYSVGRLQAYVMKFAKDPLQYEYLLPVFNRIPIWKAVQQILSADVVPFSAYVWNIRISLEIARRLRSEKPKTLIIFGGPQVPDKAEPFLRENPFIDIVVHGEGEGIFLQILENSEQGNWDEIPAVSYIDKQGNFVHHPKVGRLKELTEIPSPYLEGVFDALMAAHPEEGWIAPWESNRGCPFSCTFCDWGSATQSKVYQFDLPTLYREIDWFGERKIGYVVCCDANFGILPRDVEIAKYVAATKKKYGFPKTISLQNTKNSTERSYEVQTIIAAAGLNNGVTIAMQSLDMGTLKSIKRDNISLGSYKELQRRFTRDNVETYTDLILCLPGETYETFLNGVSETIGNGQHNRIQFSNLAILPNAEMGNPEYQKKYGMELVEVQTVNIHGTLRESEDDVNETQFLVISTNTMPREDWCKTRVLAWTVALLHFDKLFQVPLIALHELCGISFRDLFEIFMEGDFSRYPVLNEIREYFRWKAKDIQAGGEEYSNSPDWLNIWWPVDEYVLNKLSVEGKTDAFYEEAEALLNDFLKERGLEMHAVLKDAILLNKGLANLPFQTENLELELSSNLWEFYSAAKKGIQIPLENRPSRYLIDRTSSVFKSWEDWFREVVWYGSKRGAYFNKNIVSLVSQS